MFSGYFDTTLGSKKDKESFVKLSENIGLSADQLLFLTDVPTGMLFKTQLLRL